MDSQQKNLIKIASILDKSGKYILSDKIDSLIKTSQFAALPSQYKETTVRSGNPLIDSALSDLKNSTFGYQLAGGQYDMSAPGKFTGPNAPAVLKTLTPTQQAELERTNPELLAKYYLESNLQAQQYLATSNAGLAGIGRLISQWLNPNVPAQRRQSFISSVLPGTLSSIVGNEIINRPVKEWDMRLGELSKAANLAPNYSQDISKMINNALKTGIESIKFNNPAYYKQLQADKTFQNIAKRLRII